MSKALVDLVTAKKAIRNSTAVFEKMREETMALKEKVVELLRQRDAIV